MQTLNSSTIRQYLTVRGEQVSHVPRDMDSTKHTLKREGAHDYYLMAFGPLDNPHEQWVRADRIKPNPAARARDIFQRQTGVQAK